MPRIRVSAPRSGSSSRRATPRPRAGAWLLRAGRRRITTSMPQSVGLRAWSPTRSWARPKVSLCIAKRWPYLQEVWLRLWRLKERIDNRVAFAVADAQVLPFPDGCSTRLSASRSPRSWATSNFAGILRLGLIVWRAGSLSGRGPWATLRQVIGWGCIVIGLLLLILPGPGIALLIIGLMLVGRRHPLIRRISVGVKLTLRTWARQPGVRGWIGKRGKRLAHVLSGELRRVHGTAKG